MITIKFLGYDMYTLFDFTAKWHKDLVNIFKCDENELNFITSNSYLVHDGFEQTSYFIDVEISLDHKYDNVLSDAVKYLQKELHNVSIHSMIYVTYYDKVFLDIDPDYPRYMTDSNVVKTSDEILGVDSRGLNGYEDDDYDDEEDQKLSDQDIQFLNDFFKDHPELNSSDYDDDEDDDDCECCYEDNDCCCNHEHDESHHCEHHNHEHGEHCCCKNKKK